MAVVNPNPKQETERSKRENAETVTTQISQHAVQSSWDLDALMLRIGPDERIAYINSAFARHFGLAAKEDLIGQKTDLLRRFIPQEILLALAKPDEGHPVVRIAADNEGRVFEVKTTLHNRMLDVVMLDVTEKQQFRGLVQRYVLKDFENLSEEDLRTFRFPERRFMTVSFTDLRGFTALTETLRPEEVRGMINAYFEKTITAVESNDATVAQLVGDEVMALYGAPRYFKDHALRAIKSACEQVEAVEELRRHYANEGKEMCPCGVGINTGDVVLGNMGGAGKQTYTVLGAAVNLASRLCSAAKAGQILMTEVVLKAALEALPPDWEIIESHSLMEVGEDLSSVGGKIEGVHELPEELKGKIISIGAGIQSKNRPAEFSFRYLYVLKPKGVANELPVIAVERSRHAQSSRFLRDETVSGQHAEIMVGKYRLLEVIGQGGMGKVWLARDQFGNRVAIKMLSAGESATAHQVERFKREANIMAQLSHHNICRIYEIGEAEGAIYIAMEYVDGVSLADILRRGRRDSSSASGQKGGKESNESALTDLVASIKEEKKAAGESNGGAGSSPGSKDGNKPTPATKPAHSAGSSSQVMVLPMQQVLSMIAKICEAVQFAHEHGVLHRDLKPENVVLRSDGDPVIMDFGLAKFERETRASGDTGLSLSMDGQIVGTIEYMAPEQAMSSKHVTERADVYSLGAVLYELLTGRKHFVASGNVLVDAQQLQEQESAPLRQYNRQIDRDLETIVLKALHPAPTQRYASVKLLMEDIHRYQAGDPILARGPSITYRLSKWIRKNSVAFSFASLLAVTVVFGIFFYVQWRQQWGDWTEELGGQGLDFTAAPPAGPGQAKWLNDQLMFQNRDATQPAEPWQIKNGALNMVKHQWCWLRNVRISNDVRVVVKLRFAGKLDAFQICVNARRDIKNWMRNPPGYSCRFGIWGGATDIITHSSLDSMDEFNDLRLSAAPQVILPSGGTRDFTLTFEHHGERLSVFLDGKEIHREFYPRPLVDWRSGQQDSHPFELIGFRTWSDSCQLLSIQAYRFKLGERTLPTVTGDALAEAGEVSKAIDKYMSLARDYRNISTAITAQALAKAYLLSATDAREEKRERDACFKQLTALKPTFWERIWGGGPNPEYLQTINELEASSLWRDNQKEEALRRFPAIFDAHPDTRVAVNCLEYEGDSRRAREAVRDPEPSPDGYGGAGANAKVESGSKVVSEAKLPPLDTRLVEWIHRTKDLASLNLGSLGLKNLQLVEPLKNLIAIDCRDNRFISNLAPLRDMTSLRALFCQRNQIVSLLPIKGLPLQEIFCDRNKISSLEPLRGMPLESLYCRNNQIKDLSPLTKCPLFTLNCSGNEIENLDSLADMQSLGELYCAGNHIRALEPLRRLPALGILDCESNLITNLEPLKDLEQLYFLDCTGNPITSLEPFVTERDPPPSFLFDSKTLPDAELARALAVWNAKLQSAGDSGKNNLKFNVDYVKYLQVVRTGDLKKLRELAGAFNGHHYLYVQQPMTSKEADRFCRQAGAHLVTINDEQENEFLKQIVQPDASCRMGMNLKIGQPSWVTGEKVDYAPAMTEFPAVDGTFTWKNGAWLPPSSAAAAMLDRPVPMIIEWEE